MERIKQALERARKEPLTAARRVRKGRAFGSIAQSFVGYTETRIVQVSPDVLRRNRVITDTDSLDGTAYRLLRTRVLQRMIEKGWNSLAITSPSGKEGKTLTAINLAVSLSREINHTVLLADFDLRRPSVHKRFDYSPDVGIGDYLQREDIPLSQILFNPGIERLAILPGRESVPNHFEATASPRVIELVRELRTRYPDRLHLFDLPPLAALDDVLAFLPNVDAVLLVIEEGKTQRLALPRAQELLRGHVLMGTVLNKARGK